MIRVLVRSRHDSGARALLTVSLEFRHTVDGCWSRSSGQQEKKRPDDSFYPCTWRGLRGSAMRIDQGVSAATCWSLRGWWRARRGRTLESGRRVPARSHRVHVTILSNLGMTKSTCSWRDCSVSIICLRMSSPCSDASSVCYHHGLMHQCARCRLSGTPNMHRLGKAATMAHSADT
jgi:hypothetical protein